MDQDIKKPKKEWTMLHFFLGLIFWKKYASSSPIIRGLGPIPELKRPGQCPPTEKIDTEIRGITNAQKLMPPNNPIKPEKEWTMLHFFLGLIFLNKHASSSPIIRGLGPIPELKRPVKPQEK